MYPLAILCIGSTAAVSAANGANDNCKGVATLIGARVLDRRKALWLGHGTTLLGAAMSLAMASGLVKAFQGYGLLPTGLASNPHVLSIVGAAAAITVALATLLRLPISTTHALTGSLVGVGLGMAGYVSLPQLAGKFVLPLLTSPLVSAIAAGALYLVLHRCRKALGVSETTCVCVGKERRWVPVAQAHGESSLTGVNLNNASVAWHVASGAECRQRYEGNVVGIPAAAILNSLHVLSASGVSFARGVNDAPKLAALLIGATAWMTGSVAVAVVAITMFAGGVAASRRVAGTMSDRITDMNAGSAATANLVSACLVIGASFWWLPVSTTHVTCGALFGIGVAQGRAQWRNIAGIFTAWVVTLPLAASIAYTIALFVR